MLLEPVMKVEVATPDEFFGDVLGDISSRRGQVVDVDHRGHLRVITATHPAGGDVRVRDGAAVHHAGPRELHDGV